MVISIDCFEMEVTSRKFVCSYWFCFNFWTSSKLIMLSSLQVQQEKSVAYTCTCSMYLSCTPHMLVQLQRYKKQLYNACRFEWLYKLWQILILFQAAKGCILQNFPNLMIFIVNLQILVRFSWILQVFPWVNKHHCSHFMVVIFDQG